MSKADYQAYLQQAIVGYAEEKVKAGNWDEKSALQRSADDFERYLPQGEQTPGNYLNILVDEDQEEVGFIWFSVINNAQRILFLYDFEVVEKHRRKGYALQSLNILEEKARELGCGQIELHVFGFNTGAQSLYSKAGFQVTNINMRKLIE